jgi:hypothetical protein
MRIPQAYTRITFLILQGNILPWEIARDVFVILLPSHQHTSSTTAEHSLRPPL